MQDEYWKELEAVYAKKIGSAERLRKSLDFITGKLGFFPAETSIETARLLAELKSDEETVIAALLSGVQEGLLSEKQAQRELGKAVVELAGQKNTLEKALAYKPESPENSRKKLLTMLSTSPGVVLTMISETLVKLKRIRKIDHKTREFVALARDVYSPLAHQLGTYNIGSEIDDTIFSLENSKKYSETRGVIRETLKRRNEDIEKTREKIAELLSAARISHSIFGRIKSIYSAYKKAGRKKTNVKNLTDLMALRVIMETEKDCYEALGIIHSNWKPVLGEFDDYIAKPKPNGYRSLHTAIISQNNNPVEIQIRTKEMHDFSEYGIASHYYYKGQRGREKYDKKIDWIKQVLEWQKETGETTETDIFGKEIFVLTPKGQVIELPEKATALDFAYAVHSDIGNTCQGVKVNGRIASINSELKTGDLVEIITSRKQAPKMSWLSFVTTQKAKQKIRASLNIRKSETRSGEPKLEKVKISHRKIKLAKCCSPLPGDEIMGLKTTKRKISVHRKDCAFAQKLAGHMVGVEWDRKNAYYDAQLTVRAKDRSGLLKDILDVLTKNQVKVHVAQAKMGSGENVVCSFGVKLQSLKQFEMLEEKISGIRGVSRVSRE